VKAFPWVNPNDGGDESGMDLRDYFAAHALPTLIQNVHPKRDETFQAIHNRIAVSAYFLADAMMAAREVKN
jgi:hypothetical protein